MGALPNKVDGKPLYMPLNAPERQKPALLCKRVLTVSNGNKIMSTPVPAAAPDLILT